MAQLFQRWKAGGNCQPRLVCRAARPRRAARPSTGRRGMLAVAILTAAVPVVNGPANEAEFAPTGAMALLNRKGEFALSDEVRTPLHVDLWSG